MSIIALIREETELVVGEIDVVIRSGRLKIEGDKKEGEDEAENRETTADTGIEKIAKNKHDEKDENRQINDQKTYDWIILAPTGF